MKRNKLQNLLFVALVILLSSLMAGVSAKEAAPDFTLTDIDGNKFSLSDYRGKIVLLDFSATWCGPCEQQIPILKTLQEEFGENLVIITISSEDVSTLQQFRDDHAISWTVAADPTGGVSDDYDVQYIPTLVIIDQDGYIRYRHVGLTEESVLSNEINEINAQNGNGNGDGTDGTENGNANTNGDASPGFPAWLTVMLILFVAGIVLYIIYLKWGS